MGHGRWWPAALMAAALAAGPAGAATVTEFSPAAFTAAQQADQPILVDITASWCPTCAAQKPILSQLEAEPAFRGLHVFHVDFDSQKDVVRAFGARMQSTLIVFHGAVERGRSTGDTRAGSIAALLAKSAS